MSYFPLLKAAVQAFNAVIVNDWPRITHHRGDILEGLIVCWCNLQEEESMSADLKNALDSVECTLRLLTAVSKNDVDVEKEYRVLIDGDGRLRDLLNA